MPKTKPYNVSLSNDLFTRVEIEAQNLNISRSRLICNILSDYFRTKDSLQNDILPSLEKDIADIKAALKNGGISFPSDSGSFEVSERKSETDKPKNRA